MEYKKPPDLMGCGPGGIALDNRGPAAGQGPLRQQQKAALTVCQLLDRV